MRVGELCSRDVRLAYCDQALVEAAREMVAFHVGALVVVEPRGSTRRPVGILTDRDIVRGQLRRGADLFCLTVGDVMTPDPLALTADMDIGVAIEALNAKAVRRAPVVDRAGGVMGIVTLDDLLPALAEDLRSLASLMGMQARQEHRSRTR
jgi:CBS domain-containing protein